MCKHLHIGFICAATHGTDVVQKRKQEAARAYENKDFHIEDGYLHVMVGDKVGAVNLDSENCLCIAFSHGVECICVQVAQMLKSSMGSHTMENVPGPDEPEVQDPGVASPCTTTLSLYSKIEAVQDWMKENPDKVTSKQTIYINALYSSIFGKFRRVTRKRKIESVNPQRLAKNKKRKLTPDHTYCPPMVKLKHSKRHPDGAFKTKSRSKGSKRTTFQ